MFCTRETGRNLPNAALLRFSSPAVVEIAHILPTFQTYRIPPRRRLAPGGGGGGVAMATGAPRLGVVLHGVCACCEPMQSAI